jgi:DNA-binding transcriptional regulator YhcF (GntR family)
MSENRKWVGYADLLEAKRKRDEREQRATQESDRSGSVPETSQVSGTRQVPQTRQVSEAISDRSETSQVSQTSQVPETDLPAKTQNLMTSLPDVKGHTRFHHQIVDHLYPRLSVYEQVVHVHLYRLSWGYNKPSCIISLQKLSERAGLSYKTAQRAVNSLERLGLVRRQGRIVGYGKDQGLEFWVAPVTGQVSQTRQVPQTRQVSQTDIKESIIKETHTQRKKARDAPQKTHAARGVGVGSRFTIDECRSYAEHLQETGQGINNPGGFAMSIYRSGVADAFIEKFINPVEEAKPQDINACPDCQGTGFFYPHGPEQGVVKCKHERLKNPTGEGPRLTEDEISDHANLIAELLASGYSQAHAKEQFGAGLHPEDWQLISARVERSRRSE